MATVDEKQETYHRFITWKIDQHIRPSNTKYINNKRLWANEALYTKVNYLFTTTTTSNVQAVQIIKIAIKNRQLPVPIAFEEESKAYDTNTWIAMGTVIIDEVYDVYNQFWNVIQQNTVDPRL